MQNLNLLYNKLYFADENATKKIIGTEFKNQRDYKTASVATHKFYMKTNYPGLLIGSGNPHATNAKDNDAFKNGFSFDYTTGQPYIPGSSVKGILRSCFENGIAGEVLGFDKDQLSKLEKEIFDGSDVFLDAVIYDSDKTGHILGEDYITPHSDETKNPVPIKILKVLPDVKWEFRFILKDGTIKADEKQELFIDLLELFGVGAKTNVGYGVLSKTERTISEKTCVQKTNNNYQQNKQKNSQVSNSRKMKCPHCDKNIDVYNKFKPGEKNTICYICKKPLY
jgi:CRISPR-associated protein Cmr6